MVPILIPIPKSPSGFNSGTGTDSKKGRRLVEQGVELYTFLASQESTVVAREKWMSHHGRSVAEIYIA